MQAEMLKVREAAAAELQAARSEARAEIEARSRSTSHRAER